MGGDYAAREALKHVGKAWAQTDPQSALQHAMTLNGETRSAFASEIIGVWATRDLKAAIAFASAPENAAMKASVAGGLVNTWAKTDPAGALQWSQENLRGMAQTQAIAGLVKTVSEKDIEAAGDLVASMAPGVAQNSACASIFETWFKKGKEQRDAALAWLAELPDPRARELALERVQWDWSWNDPDGARDFVSGPHGSLASSSLLHQVARTQASKNPEAAMDWAASLPKERAELARQAVLSQWLQVRPEGAAAYALKLPAGKDRDMAISSISQNMLFASTGLEQALSWIRKLPAEDRGTAAEAIRRIGMDAERLRRVEEALKN
jgi:hypothetical protein